MMFSHFYCTLTRFYVKSISIAFDTNLFNCEVGTPCLFGQIKKAIISFTAYLSKFINS